MDYTSPDSFEGKSLVTGHLGLRDPGLGMTAVAGFNRALLQSGIVREFIKEHQDRAQQVGSSQARSHQEKKRDFLRYMVEKRGLQHFSQLGGGSQRTNLVQRDIVMFPYTFDYLQELPS